MLKCFLMPPAALTPLAKRIGLLLFLALNFLFLITSSGRVRTIDEVSVDLQAESLALHGNAAVPQAEALGTFYGKRDRWGQARAPYGTAQAVLVLPWHFAGRILRAVLPGIPARSKDLVLDAVVASSSGTFAALAAALAFLIFCRLGIDVKRALWAALVIALATPLFAYSAWFFSEPLVAALLLAAALALFTGEAAVPISWKAAAIAGIFLGVALWVRPSHLIAAPVFFVALLLRDRKKGLTAAFTLAVVVGIFGGAYLVRNQIYFGNAFEFGYPDVAEGGRHLNTFRTPLATGLFGFLLSPGKSVFLFAPPIVLAIAGLRRLWRRDAGLAVVAAGSPLIYLLFFARYTQWEGGYCVGPRYLVPSLVVLCLGLGPMLAEASPRVRKLAVILFASGMFVQMISISTSFLEDQATGSYYDAQWNYRMEYSSVTQQERLLLHYMTTSQPAPIGLGFDRWFVFLGKAGVSRGLLAAGLCVEFAGLLFFGWRLRRALPMTTGNISS
jgi:4-amino-4-deoxy-L-arabinose transferase-like glycosyltransferase